MQDLDHLFNAFLGQRKAIGQMSFGDKDEKPLTSQLSYIAWPVEDNSGE